MVVGGRQGGVPGLSPKAPFISLQGVAGNGGLIDFLVQH